MKSCQDPLEINEGNAANIILRKQALTARKSGEMGPEGVSVLFPGGEGQANVRRKGGAEINTFIYSLSL